MNDTTFQGDGKVAYVPVVVSAKQHPMTNADRIRAMDIDQLIEWHCRGKPCGSCPYGGVECGIRDWLQQEAE